MSPKSSTGQHSLDAAGPPHPLGGKRGNLPTVGVTVPRDLAPAAGSRAAGAARVGAAAPRHAGLRDQTPAGTNAESPMLHRQANSPRNGNTARRAATTA
ncbi:hypothetical protein GCM10010279_33680 [Streptomyces mutabilis]|nr:hypothetical protein GCM10010279_33680 [Streptomyces mutabilis]